MKKITDILTVTLLLMIFFTIFQLNTTVKEINETQGEMLLELTTLLNFISLPQLEIEIIKSNL